jgi:phosphoserine phosphatase RsbU/P
MLPSFSKQKLVSLIEIAQRINSSSDLHETLTIIMAAAKQMMNSEASSLLLIDEETKGLYFNITTGMGKDILEQIRLPRGKGIAGLVASTGEGIIVNNAEKDGRVFREVEERTKIVTRNMICVPLEIKGHNLGVLEVINKRGSHDYTNEDLDLLRSFAVLAALAIHTRDLYRKMQRRAYEARALYRLSETINFCESVDELLKENALIVSEVLEAQRVSVLLRDKGTFRLRAGVGIAGSMPTEGQISSSPVLDYILGTSSGVFSSNIEEEERFSHMNISRYEDKSFVAVPMKMKNQIVAFLCVTERSRKQPYMYEDLRLLEMLAQQVVENYNHFKLTEEFKKKQIMEAELSITARIQQDILPKKFFSDGYMDIAARSIPAKLVAGDFYDYISMAEGRYGIIMADVSGKGMPAGFFMAVSRSILRSRFFDDRSPVKILEAANRYLSEDSSNCMFVTCFCCVIDTAAKEIIYSSAGHMSQYLLKSKNGRVNLLHTHGKPLGIIGDVAYTEMRMKYASGDILMLFTDGITDAIHTDSEPYGEERLKTILMKAGSMSSENILNRIIDDVTHFQGKGEPVDDMTLLVARFLK